jgi:hypothetical protein
MNFLFQGNYERHLEYHKGEKKYKCLFEGCKQQFSTNTLRLWHAETHVKKGHLSCNICGKM